MVERRQLQVELVDLAGLVTRGLPGTQKVACKFVMIARTGELAFVFGPVRQYPYHAHLVDAYCRCHDIPATWIKKPDVVEIFDDDCVVRGGGWLELDPAGRKMKVYGKSTAYGAFDTRDLNDILKGAPALDGYTVHVKA